MVIISIHIHSPLEAARRRASRSVLAEFVLRRRTHCYFQASDRNSVIAIIFIDHDFLLDSNDLVIERNFQLICHSTDKNLLYFYFRSIWLNDLEHVSHVALRTGMTFIKFELGQAIRLWLTTFLLLIRYVTLWPWPLTPWSWTFVVHHVFKFYTKYEGNRIIRGRVVAN